MSIEAKHAYRFGFLKSEKWARVRLEALVREGGKCEVCKKESIENDAHHVWYPENIYETQEHQLSILCRECHEFVHLLIPECKTRDKDKGIAMWLKFTEMIKKWRASHDELFSTQVIEQDTIGTEELRTIIYDVLEILKGVECSEVEKKKISKAKQLLRSIAWHHHGSTFRKNNS